MLQFFFVRASEVSYVALVLSLFVRNHFCHASERLFLVIVAFSGYVH